MILFTIPDRLYITMLHLQAILIGRHRWSIFCRLIKACADLIERVLLHSVLLNMFYISYRCLGWTRVIGNHDRQRRTCRNDHVNSHRTRESDDYSTLRSATGSTLNRGFPRNSDHNDIFRPDRNNKRPRKWDRNARFFWSEFYRTANCRRPTRDRITSRANEGELFQHLGRIIWSRHCQDVLWDEGFRMLQHAGVCGVCCQYRPWWTGGIWSFYETNAHVL